MNAEKIRVLIVDDSFFMRKVIGDFLRSDPNIEVVGEASDGRAALKSIAKLHPQVVTLDIEMPTMNGVETLREIIQSPRYPSVVIVSGYAQEGAAVTLQCLSMGAADFVLKPSGSLSLDMDKIKSQVIEKVKLAAEVDTTKIRPLDSLSPKDWPYHKTGGAVVIGASTGGPVALEILLPAFPKNFPYPIIVAQHLPKEFTATFTNRLDNRCALKVVRAEHTMRVTAGNIYIASGNTRTTITKNASHPTFVVEDDPKSLETPSINQLMESAAAIYHDKTIGIILTGMGQDGARGMERIKQVGGSTIVQDQSTSVVFGMPGEVVARKAADEVVPLSHILEKVDQLLT